MHKHYRYYNTYIMIRVETILCKLNSIKLSDKELFYQINSFERLSQNTKCPYCGSTHPFDYHSSYERYLTYISKGRRADCLVKIFRGICACGHTHAMLEDLLIPYSSYSIRFVLIILWKYLHRSMSVEVLCNQFQISKSTLYKWIHSFVDQYNLWFGVIKYISSITADALKCFMSVPRLPYLFFENFRFSLFQSYKTTVSDP